ncbi:BT4 [Symbiodinium necroappetens]|uniref:BT4 protein n=1 Tax=Symbiodinium necroappetens TaxID=1628268 RepID=A0A813B2W4_9DINO|nr:BT4 [Symbiodinium necroappetens]
MADVVRALIRVGDLEGLQRVTPDGYDWSVPDSKARPPLIEVMLGPYAQWETRAKMLDWMIKAGADPLKAVPADEASSCAIDVGRGHEKIKIPYKGNCATTFACEAVRALQESEHVAASDVKLKAFKGYLDVLTRATPMLGQSNVAIPQSVVDMWESIRQMTPTHNVVFETADGEVSAHDLILVTASPVLKAMLESTMREGSSKRITVKDSSGSGVRLLVDMLYTSSTRDEPDYKTVLVALDLAHRWQVNGMVPVLEGILPAMVTVESLVAIAEAAMLKGLQKLQQACKTFAANNSQVKTMLDRGPIPVEVRQLLGEPADPSPEGGRQKKRRTFTAP